MLTLSKILPREEEETLIQGLSLVKEKVNILWSDLVGKYLITTSTEVYLVDSINEIISKIMSTDADNIPDNNKIPICAIRDPNFEQYLAVVFDDSTGEVYGYIFDTNSNVLDSLIITSNSGIIGNSRNAIVEVDLVNLNYFGVIIYPNRLQELYINLFSGEAELFPNDGWFLIAYEPFRDVYIDSYTHLNMEGDDILSGRTILYVEDSQTILPTYIGETIVIRNEPNRLIFLAEDLGKDSLSLFIVEYPFNEDANRFETTVSYTPLGRNYFIGPEPPPIDYKLSAIRSITNIMGEDIDEEYSCRILFDNPPYVLEGKIPNMEPDLPPIFWNVSMKDIKHTGGCGVFEDNNWSGEGYSWKVAVLTDSPKVTINGIKVELRDDGMYFAETPEFEACTSDKGDGLGCNKIQHVIVIYDNKEVLYEGGFMNPGCI